MRETQARIDSFSGSTRLIAFREIVAGAARLDSSSEIFHFLRTSAGDPLTSVGVYLG
jgi:hypothetical protein